MGGAEQVREAVSRIKPLPSSDGPNFYTVEVEGWGLSAPTTLQLNRMLWDWFNPRPSVVEHIAAVEAMLDAWGTGFGITTARVRRTSPTPNPETPHD